MLDRTISVRALLRGGVLLAALAALCIGALAAYAQATGSSASCTAPAPAATNAVAGNGFWSPAPNAGGKDTYFGAIDSPGNGATVASSFVVNGWAADTTANGWAGFDQVQLYNGQMGSGGTLVAAGVIGGGRPDVANALGNQSFTNSGFYVIVPASAGLSGSVNLNLYVHTPAKGWWGHAFTLNVSGAAPVAAAAPAAASAPAPANVSGATAPVVKITAPGAGENVSAPNNNYTIRGTATDPTYGNGAIDQVDVWIDGQRGAPGSHEVGFATINGDGTFSLAFSPTNYSSINSNLYVYAHSKVTGKTTAANVNFNIVG